ncbi:MAG: hypothetical protein ACLU9S_16275 [Oscillospiraceae bacterium]
MKRGAPVVLDSSGKLAAVTVSGVRGTIRPRPPACMAFSRRM